MSSSRYTTGSVDGWHGVSQSTRANAALPQLQAFKKRRCQVRLPPLPIRVSTALALDLGTPLHGAVSSHARVGTALSPQRCWL